MKLMLTRRSLSSFVQCLVPWTWATSSKIIRGCGSVPAPTQELSAPTFPAAATSTATAGTTCTTHTPLNESHVRNEPPRRDHHLEDVRIHGRGVSRSLFPRPRPVLPVAVSQESEWLQADREHTPGDSKHDCRDVRKKSGIKPTVSPRPSVFHYIAVTTYSAPSCIPARQTDLLKAPIHQQDSISLFPERRRVPGRTGQRHAYNDCETVNAAPTSRGTIMTSVQSRNWRYPGARWWKFDFHTHTPASHDTHWYRSNQNRLTPHQWLQRFMMQELIVSA